MWSNTRIHTIAALVAVLAAAGLWLPWWTAGHPAYLVTQRSVTEQGTESLRGIDVVGSWAITLVIGAAVAAVVAAVLESRAMWWWIAAAGVAQAAVAVVVAASWGVDLGSVATFAAGLVVAVIALRALVVAMPNRFKAVPAVLLLVAVPAGFVPADKLGDTTDRDPFERLTNIGSSVVPVDDGVGVVWGGNLSTVADIRPTPLARLDDWGTPLGVVDGRLVVFWSRTGGDDNGAVWTMRLGARGEAPAKLTGVRAVGEMSPEGTLLVETEDGDTRSVRRLDVRRLAGGAETPAGTLPEVKMPGARGFPYYGDGPGSLDLVDQPGTGRVAVVDNYNAVGARLSVTGPGDEEGRFVAGGYDPSCGLTARGPDSFFPWINAKAADGKDGWWFTTDSRLFHLAGNGTLRATAPLNVGEPATLVVADGALHIGTSDGVWRLPDPESRLETLPEPGPGCFAHPEVGRPAQLTPLPVPPHTNHLLDVSGRHAGLTTSGAIEVVEADGTRTPVGPREGESDGGLEFVPDGAGGLWWLETVVPVPGRPLARQLVHAAADGTVTRQAPVPGGGDRNHLFADLSSGAPLVGRCPPTRLADGAERTIPAIENLTGEDDCMSPVVGRDGHGWVVAEGGLHRFAPAGSGPSTPVIGGEKADEAPVSVRLARGTTPGDVWLRTASLAFDSTGRLLVLSEDVLLGVAANGSISVLAQDERFRHGRLTAVEGGAVVTLRDGSVHRLGY